MVDELLRRTASSEWRDWEETLESFGAPGLMDATGLEMDLHSLDQFLLATADGFLEPFADTNSAPESPIFAADSGYFYEQDQGLSILEAGGFDTRLDSEGELLERKLETQLLQQSAVNSTAQRNRKRKTAELHRLRGEAGRLTVDTLHLEKKLKRSQRQQTAQNKEIVAMQSERETNAQAEKLFRRRYDILHGILEAWNTGGIEDLEEIADNVYDDDVTLIGPDYMEGLHGVEAVMSHWTTLLDAFPDGIMEEYTIQCDGGSGEKMTASWVFSGTQIYPIHGVQPRHKKVCINGKSFFSFKGDKIQQVVLSWNYHETLLKLMGVLTPAALAGAVQL
ncbi:hypothetical protein BBO99_00000559 [Phytophthora kernoviae]|uniref:SnoaL-like domain-containing protein n=2 Tax=Phytophthora kernoviae TaxID=325452 RepID=A0A3R7G298_9STRA|nr:hypothetical protein G195_001454 [Phytophthora kernoviae 00238/432]KAG2532147.1 hypothetical protein JM16_000503 [Phytophthora kernoviae]KAG2533197.1 hypothetical protein JM18_000584 [Phytophthora kernoviae]RLN26098.1 hypothetical protein BBI17_000598 [Phytophthora kernoviae]RLN85458.1 hypothetical protein BBO99_00000559 [Phytophthora kernoviae]